MPLWCSRNEDFIAIGFVEFALWLKGRVNTNTDTDTDTGKGVQRGRINCINQLTNLAIKGLYAPRKVVLGSSKCWAIHAGQEDIRVRVRGRGEVRVRAEPLWAAEYRGTWGYD